MRTGSFYHIRMVLYLALIITAGLFLAACNGSSEPVTFNPQLFTKPDQTDKECSLAVGNVETSFSESNNHDVKLRISGVMNKYCSNLTVSMDEPDIGKNIRVELGASTTSAAGGNDRPFEVELQVNALRFGSYTIWINGDAMKIFSVE